MEKLRGWIKRRPLIWTIGLLVGGLILGAAAGGSGKSSLEDEKAELQNDVALAISKQEGAEETASRETQRIKNREQRVIDAAEQKATGILGHAKVEAEELENVEGRIAATEEELASIEGSLQGAEHTKALSTFGEGIERSEVDFVPGTYEAPGGDGCYWATLNSANTQDIVDNEFAVNASQQIVTIETPYFQSSECGTWKLVE